MLPPILPWWHPPNPVFPSRDHVRWLQLGQLFEPKACCLGFPVTKLPWLDDLIRWPYARCDAPDGILHGNACDWRVQQPANKPQCLFGLRCPRWPAFVPMQPGRAEIGARRMGNHHVPAICQYRQRIALDVLPWRLRGKKVATPSVPSACLERIADSSTELASYQYSRHVSLRVRPQRGPSRQVICFRLGIFRVKTVSQNWPSRFPETENVFRPEFPGKKRNSKFNFGISDRLRVGG